MSLTLGYLCTKYCLTKASLLYIPCFGDCLLIHLNGIFSESLFYNLYIKYFYISYVQNVNYYCLSFIEKKNWCFTSKINLHLFSLVTFYISVVVYSANDSFRIALWLYCISLDSIRSCILVCAQGI